MAPLAIEAVPASIAPLDGTPSSGNSGPSGES